MRYLSTAVLLVAAMLILGAAPGPASYDLPPNQVQTLEKSLPDRAPAKPRSPRKVLVFGRVPLHQDPVRFSARSLELLAKKTGAFEVVISADENSFLPENLKQFDAVVMNNSHEAHPLCPANYKTLDAAAKKQAEAQEAVLQKSLMDFVESGRGIVGLHAATAGVKWLEYNKMMGGDYAGHFGGQVTIKAEDPRHVLCAALGEATIELRDEIYVFRAPYSREHVKVLLSLDMSRTTDPQKRPDKDYPISWIRQQGKGRVFYCSVPAHALASYQCKPLMEHLLAGLQWALGDLEIK